MWLTRKYLSHTTALHTGNVVDIACLVFRHWQNFHFFEGSSKRKITIPSIWMLKPVSVYFRFLGCASAMQLHNNHYFKLPFWTFAWCLVLDLEQIEAIEAMVISGLGHLLCSLWGWKTFQSCFIVCTNSVINIFLIRRCFVFILEAEKWLVHFLRRKTTVIQISAVLFVPSSKI